MPFHPWCFEIFIRLSRQRFGRVDVDGLMDWRDHQHGVADRLRTFERWGPRHTEPDAFDCIPRHEDVKRSQDQEWRHVRGCEYLAANPVLVPNLSEILHAAIEPGVDGQDGVFQLTERDMEMRDSNPSDLFLKLSSELRLGILEHLDGASIASLRLSSRAFRQLPQTLFYMLLRHEFPSLWEAAQNIEGDQSSYFWSRIRAREIAPYIDNRDDPAQRDFHDDIDQFRTAIREEMPEMYDDWLAAEPNYQTYLNAPPWPPSMPEQTRLRKGQTNWHRVYVSLNKELGKGELKGLKNRERIWKDVSRIVEKISECREEGHIP